MKILFLMTLWLCAGIAFASPGSYAWKKADLAGKIFLLQEYKAFYLEIGNTESLADLEAKTSLRWQEFFISSAWASENLDCFYVGWPSRRVNNVCTSPARNNPAYQTGACSSGELQCQPRFYGKDLCVPIGTQAQRNSAMAACERKFQESGRSAADVIAQTQAEGKEAALLELIGAADRICGESEQRGRGICPRIAAAVNRVRSGASEAVPTEPRIGARATAEGATPPTRTRGPQTRAPTATPPDTINRRPTTGTTPRVAAPMAAQPPVRRPTQTQEQLEQAVVIANRGLQQVNLSDDCEVERQGQPFERDEPRNFQFVSLGAQLDENWDTLVTNSNLGPVPRGFQIVNRGPNEIVATGDQREWQFISSDNSRRETYITIGDGIGGRVSNNLESVIVLIPRRVQPRVESLGNVVRVTLATGERVIFDKASGRVLRGAFRENRVTQGNFNNVAYTGTGISIRINKRAGDPRESQGQATITQNGRSCQVPTSQLWNRDANFRYSDDRQLVQFLNQRCSGGRFSI